MPGSGARRRLATVLFVDIVGSTALATELGDARWRELLTRFRRLVRAELKRYGGHERDTAGDGLFATFGEPARALRAAVAIAIAVQEIGVDVRAGVHTGECEEIDGTLGGIAVHIGARVMALAGPAEVLVTGTVKDLVAGSGATFDDRGAHELKGVPGTWPVFALQAVEMSLPTPLTREEIEARLSLLAGSPRLRRRRVWMAAAGIAIAGAAAAGVLLTTARGGGPARTAAPGGPVRLIRIDAQTERTTATVRTGPSSKGDWSNLWDVNGTLWQFVGSPSDARLVARQLPSGRLEKSVPVPGGCSCGVAFGFGSIWLANKSIVVSGPNAGLGRVVLERVDQLSGRELKTISFLGNIDGGTIATGNGAVWVLDSTGRLTRIDPLTDHVVGSYETGARETSTLIPVAGQDWICQCLFNSVLRFDPKTSRTRTFHIPEQAYLVGVESSHGATLWLLDPVGATLTPMDPVSGKTGQPLGLDGDPQQAVIAFGAIWTAAGRVVDRVDLQSRTRTTIAMPPGVWAGGIAADPATHSLWVGNSVSAPTSS
jgi:class 3 adenylate cyclase